MLLLDHPALLFVATCLALWLAHEAGFRLRAVASHDEDKAWPKQVQATRNQLAILLSLIIGFALSMALGRFDERKQLVIDEANAIGTAYLRSSMQAEPIRSQASLLLRDYVKARLDGFGKNATEALRADAAKRSKRIQDALWNDASAAARQTPTPIVSIYAQALNDVIDIDSKRSAAVNNRVPFDIWLLLGALALTTSVIIGFGQRERSWLVTAVPILTTAIALSLIADLDTPTSGFIRVGQQSLRVLDAELSVAYPR